jgi:3-carboxy-cis,cis-muconate cycloisomerase
MTPLPETLATARSPTTPNPVHDTASDDEAGTSAMPHKRNPVLATLIRAAVGAAAGVSAPDRRRGRGGGGAAEGLTPFPDPMRANPDATGSLIVTERVAAALTPTFGKAAAKDLVSRVNARATGQQRPHVEVLAEEPELAGILGPAELAELLDPARYTGTAAELVDRVLRRYREPGRLSG